MMKTVYYPRPLATAARQPLFASIFVIILDIGMMIIAIMAYTGASSSSDSDTIKETYITFPTAGHHIQRLEIALPSLSLVVTLTLAILIMIRVGRLNHKYNDENRLGVQRVIMFFYLPWHFVNLLAWAACVGFQSSYVPLVDYNILPECAEYGSDLTQCGMVTGSWIMALIYCFVHIVMIGFGLNISYHLHYPALEDRSPKHYNLATPTRWPSVAPSIRSSRPPSYRTSETAPPNYHHHQHNANERNGPPRLEMLVEND